MARVALKLELPAFFNSDEGPDLASGAANNLRVGVSFLSSGVLLLKAVALPELPPGAETPFLSVPDSGEHSFVVAELKGKGDTSLLVGRLVLVD